MGKNEERNECVYAAFAHRMDEDVGEVELIKIGVTKNLDRRMLKTGLDALFSMPDSMSGRMWYGREYWKGDLEQSIISFFRSIGVMYHNNGKYFKGHTEMVHFDDENRSFILGNLENATQDVRFFIEQTIEEYESYISSYSV